MDWHTLELTPRDLLFFRDARPMDGSSIGHGARWPEPNLLHDALIESMKQFWPERQSWEFIHTHRNAYDRRDALNDLRFGGLQATALFPIKGNQVLLPRPADLDPNGNPMRLHELTAGHSDLPAFITHAPLPEDKPTKKETAAWLTPEGWTAYLKQVPLAEAHGIPATRLYDLEHRYGIEIAPKTGSVVKSKLYMAEYMRLRDDVSLRGFARCISRCRDSQSTDVIKCFFAHTPRHDLVLGGQQGLAACHYAAPGTTLPLPEPLATASDSPQGCIVKWILLSPAILAGGWYPGWVDPANGEVRLTSEKPPRNPGESRAEWRSRFPPALKAKLFAAAIGKPVPVSGWKRHSGTPRPARLAVPAGSVFWFKAETPHHAGALRRALHGQFKSDTYGERGYGLGVAIQTDTSASFINK